MWVLFWKMWTYHLIDHDPGDESLSLWHLWKAVQRDSHLSVLEIYSAFNRRLIYMKSSKQHLHQHATASFLSLATCAADSGTADSEQHGKPKCCLSMKVLSVKLTPSLECHRTAWRHGGASFMKPVPAPLQMSHGEFFTASQSPGRQSRKPYYIWGQAPLKLTATAATAKLAERERERERYVRHLYVTTEKIAHKLVSFALDCGAARRTMDFAVKIERTVWIMLTAPIQNYLVRAVVLEMLLYWFHTNTK